jgi:hypothetical protein
LDVGREQFAHLLKLRPLLCDAFAGRASLHVCGIFRRAGLKVGARKACPDLAR